MGKNYKIVRLASLHELPLVSGFDGKCKVHSFFVVSRLSIEIHLSIQGLPIVMGNSVRNACLGTAKND